MRDVDRWAVWTYAAALSLFVTHGIDSTRFGEWILFRMSPATYVFSYLPAVAIALYGLVALTRGLRNGYQLALLLGLIDMAALFVHAPQIAADIAFRTPLSIALILAMEVAGAALVLIALWELVWSSARQGLLTEGRPSWG